MRRAFACPPAMSSRRSTSWDDSSKSRSSSWTEGAATRRDTACSKRSVSTARGCLTDTGETDAIGSRHAAVFLKEAELAYVERFAKEQQWAVVLETEHDNLRAALEFFRESDGEKYLQPSLARSPGSGRCARISSKAATTSPQRSPRRRLTPPRPARARALWGAANTNAWQGSAAAGRPMMEEALQMWRDVGNLPEVAVALEGIGWIQFIGGDDAAAIGTFEECLRIQREQGDPVLINRAMVAVAQVLVALSRVDEARPMAETIIAFTKSRGDRRNEHFGWHFLADCALIESDCVEGLRLYQESLRHAQAIGDRLEMAFEVQGVAMSLAGLGRADESIALAAAATAEWQRLGVDLRHAVLGCAARSLCWRGAPRPRRSRRTAM